MSFLRWLPERWRRRIRDYAPRGFPDAASCGAFYDARARLFGDDEAAVLEYSDLSVQERLFERAAALLPPRGRVLDVGCGLGHLYDYIVRSAFDVTSYHGIDVSAAVLDRAVQRIGDDDRVHLASVDLTREDLAEGSHDVGYIISVLGYPIGRDPTASMMTILEKAFAACTGGIVFTHVMEGRRERPLAFPTVPEELAACCKRALGAEATIDDDGVDFTYLMRLVRRE